MEDEPFTTNKPIEAAYLYIQNGYNRLSPRQIPVTTEVTRYSQKGRPIVAFYFPDYDVQRSFMDAYNARTDDSLVYAAELEEAMNLVTDLIYKSK